MKKSVKSILAILMVISVFATLTISASAATTGYLDAGKFTITDPNGTQQPTVENGLVTFKVNVSSDTTITAALVSVKFDNSVLKVVDAGPCTTTDSDGNKQDIVTGLHTNGMSKDSNSVYTFAYISANGFKTGSTGKEFVYITFQVIDPSYPLTTVEFVAGDYTSTEIIKSYKNMATLDSGIITSIKAGEKSLEVSWNAVKGANEYVVYRKGGVDTSFRAIASTTELSYKDTENLENNTTYQYAVRAKNAYGAGWYVTKTYAYMDTMKLTLINDKTGVKIAWDNVEGATEYRIYRRPKGESSWTRIAKVDDTVLTVVDDTLTSGINYEYTGVVYRSSYASRTADVKEIFHVSMVEKVTLANAANGVTVKWNEIKGAEKYRVYRKVKGESSWTTLATVDGDVLSYTDAKATSGKVNYYTVRAYAGGTWGAYKSFSITHLAAPKASSVTSNIGTGITIKWSKVSGAKQYRVYRKSSGDKSWKLLGKTTSTSYVDKSVTLGKKYTYTLRAENGSNLSGYKSGWSATYTLKTPVVSSISASSNSITIKWGKISGATGYRVYRKAQGQSGWERIATIKGASYTDKNISKNVKYSYTVRAYKGSTLSEYNKTGWAAAVMSVPTVKIANNASGVKVSWSKNKCADGYVMYRSQYNATTKKWTSWKNMGTVKATQTSWVDGSVSSGVKYKYTVRTLCGTIKSPYKQSSTLLYLAQPKVSFLASDGAITVSWNKVSGATGYRVYSSVLNEETGKWTSWKNMGTVKSSKTTYVDDSVLNGRTYKYTVRAVNGKTLSTYMATEGLAFLG